MRPQAKLNVGVFSLGQVVSTPGALNALNENGKDIAEYLQRHVNGDWGDLGDEDKQTNDAAVISAEDRILSAYILPDKTKVWIITEWDRSVTTVLLPEEY
jgi:hypothetical protein